jgi:hypothetical protein
MQTPVNLNEINSWKKNIEIKIGIITDSWSTHDFIFKYSCKKMDINFVTRSGKKHINIWTVPFMLDDLMRI